MARKSTKAAKATTDQAAQPLGATPLGIMQALDAFQNVLARTGYGTTNLMEGTDYPLTRLTKNYNLMNSLYRNSWLAQRIIDTIPKDMLKNWVKYVSDITPEEVDKIHRMERLTRIKPALRQGLSWGRLYGGAAGLMMIEGQEEQLEEPLDLNAVMPGDFKGLLIVDRWSGVYPQLQLVTDISSPEFGLPEFYEFRDAVQGEVSKVHHSRIVRFIGNDLPEWEKQAETYWGASVIESVYEEIKKRDNTSANLAGLIFLANLRVLKMSDMGELLTGTNTNSQQDFYNTIQAQNWLQSNFGMYVMSKEDDFQTFNMTFSGLNEVYECFMMDLAGATQIPITKLFGRSPAGMNSTGESDMRNYYDVVEQDQEAKLRPALEKLLPVLSMSTLGYVPDDIELMFNPIETPSEKDMGDTVKWKSEAVLGAHDRGIISDQIALKELKQMSEGTGIFTNITDEDIENASDTVQQPLMMEHPEEDAGSEL